MKLLLFLLLFLLVLEKKTSINTDSKKPFLLDTNKNNSKLYILKKNNYIIKNLKKKYNNSLLKYLRNYNKNNIYINEIFSNESKNCNNIHIINDHGCYGKYQIKENICKMFNYKFGGMSELEQDELMIKLIDYYDELLGGYEKYINKYHNGIFITKMGLIYSMHFVPYGTINYLKTGEDFNDGYSSIKKILEKYENFNENERK